MRVRIANGLRLAVDDGTRLLQDFLQYPSFPNADHVIHLVLRKIEGLIFQTDDSYPLVDLQTAV